MEQGPSFELQADISEGGLKELVLRWFTWSQAQFLLRNGNFPSWFRGFATRKDVEDLLRNEAVGSFLIRLSDKAIGYILSYKGRDRCRHFVVTQNQAGLFSLSGAGQTYRSLTQLIEHYEVNPILPFGEYLTSSCHEANPGELYEAWNAESKGISGVSVKALQTLWDQRCKNHSVHGNDPTARPPPLPPKTRKLTGSVSADAVTRSQAVAPAPKGGRPLGVSRSEPSPDRQTLTDPNQTVRLRGTTNPVLMKARAEGSLAFNSPPGDQWPKTATGTTDMILKQLEGRRQSLPRLDINMEQENQPSGTAFTRPTSYSPTSLRKVTCSLYSPRPEQHKVHETLRANPLYQTSSAQREVNMYAEVSRDPRPPRSLYSPRPEQHKVHETLRANPLYQTSSAQREVNMYAEVSREPRPPRSTLHDDTYNQVPGVDTTYETLEDTETSKSTGGKNNTKWMKFLPEYKTK